MGPSVPEAANLAAREQRDLSRTVVHAPPPNAGTFRPKAPGHWAMAHRPPGLDRVAARPSYSFAARWS